MPASRAALVTRSRPNPIPGARHHSPTNYPTPRWGWGEAPPYQG
jgi:hypothetical protein